MLDFGLFHLVLRSQEITKHITPAGNYIHQLLHIVTLTGKPLSFSGLMNLGGHFKVDETEAMLHAQEMSFGIQVTRPSHNTVHLALK